MRISPTRSSEHNMRHNSAWATSVPAAKSDTVMKRRDLLKALAAPLGKSGEFPLEIVEMIAVGEEANNLEQVLIDVADTLERQTNRTLDLFVRMLEPVMLTAPAAPAAPWPVPRKRLPPLPP